MAYEMFIAIFIAVAILILFISGVAIIQPYEQALWIVLGQYKNG